MSVALPALGPMLEAPALAANATVARPALASTKTAVLTVASRAAKAAVAWPATGAIDIAGWFAARTTLPSPLFGSTFGIAALAVNATLARPAGASVEVVVLTVASKAPKAMVP